MLWIAARIHAALVFELTAFARAAPSGLKGVLASFIAGRTRPDPFPQMATCRVRSFLADITRDYVAPRLREQKCSRSQPTGHTKYVRYALMSYTVAPFVSKHLFSCRGFLPLYAARSCLCCVLRPMGPLAVASIAGSSKLAPV